MFPFADRVCVAAPLFFSESFRLYYFRNDWYCCEGWCVFGEDSSAVGLFGIIFSSLGSSFLVVASVFGLFRYVTFQSWLGGCVSGFYCAS